MAVRHVWFYHRNQLCSGVVLQQQNDAGSNTHYHILIKSVEGIAPNRNTYCVTHNCFDTKEACIADHTRRLDEMVTQYKNEITDIPSLVRFCLTRVVACGNDCNWEARRAVTERAAELGLQI